MSVQASGSAKPVNINVEVAWHDQRKQPLVMLQINEGGVAIEPEAAVELGMTLISAAHSSMHEGHLRTFMATSAGMDPIQVVAALTTYRSLAGSRIKRRNEERQSVKKIFLHQERVDRANGDPERALLEFNCVWPGCEAKPGEQCTRSVGEE